MALLDDLLAYEHRLSSADIGFYRHICRPDALFIMPGMVASLEEAIAGLEQSPPWGSVDLSDVSLRMIGSNAAAIIYRFTGTRGTATYRADMVSTYENRGGWRLVLHQQTPLA